MRTLMEIVADGKMGARHTDPVTVVFEQRFEEIFKRLAKGGRTPALRVQYHYMVDVIKIFIRTEWLEDHNGHLSCIVRQLYSCRAPSMCQGGMAAPLTHEATRSYPLTRTPSKVSLPMGAMLSFTLAMIGVAPGVTSVLSRH